MSTDIEPVYLSRGGSGSGGTGSVTMAFGHLEDLWCDDNVANVQFVSGNTWLCGVLQHCMREVPCILQEL